MNHLDQLTREPHLFNEMALELFRYQALNNALYRDWLEGLGCDPKEVLDINDIPALPIAFFRSQQVQTRPLYQIEGIPEQATGSEPLVFSSSGSSSQTASRHFVPRPELYRQAFLRAFEQEFGDPGEWAFFFLLPSYLEREGSSLVWMCRELAALSRQPESGFFLNEHLTLMERVSSALKRNQPSMLLGVSFALLDLAESGLWNPIHRERLLVVETGGMKGRRRELLREELHARLCSGLGVERILSEYGMTELLSQAWSRGEGRFCCPPWMRVRIRELNDPLSPAKTGALGAIDVLDLANVDSCAFIATDDLGRLHEDGSFEVLGRIDHSDVRGCNLLLS